MASSRKILQGVRVLELANVLAGPSVGQFLAELGATVIKVENNSTGGDVTRSWRLGSEPQPANGVTAYFSSCNSGKKSIAVNLRDDRGRDVIHKLSAKSDIVVASYKPGDAEKLGVDAGTLRAFNPGLIYAQITGYGLDDPRPGYDAVIQAETGFQYMNGEPSGGPVKMPVALMDVLAGHQLKEAILINLWRREKFDEQVGADINVSLHSAGVASLVNQAAAYLKLGVVPQRLGSDHPSIFPYGTVLTTRDEEQLTLAIGSDKHFEILCNILNIGDVPKDARFTKNADRVKHRAVLRPLLEQAVRNVDRAPLLERLNEAAVPAGAVNSLEHVFQSPLANDLVFRGEDGETMTGLRQVAFRGSFPESVGPDTNRLSDPPSCGEHTHEILQGSLGMSDDEIRELVAQGVVQSD